MSINIFFMSIHYSSLLRHVLFSQSALAWSLEGFRMAATGPGVGEKSTESPDIQTNEIATHEILPPRLEDAGLEDCALPLESIQEAFLKAAAASLRDSSPSTSDDEAETEDLVEFRDPADCTSVDISRASKSDDAHAAQDRGSDANTVILKKKDAAVSKEACVEGLQKLGIR